MGSERGPVGLFVTTRLVCEVCDAVSDPNPSVQEIVDWSAAHRQESPRCFEEVED